MIWADATRTWDEPGLNWIPDYENVVFDRVSDDLYALLQNEFDIPIRFDQHVGNQSFLVTLVEDRLENVFSTGQIREYIFDINYELATKGSLDKNKIKQLTNVVERVKRLMHNNINVNEGFYGGRILNATLQQNNAIMQFSCFFAEVSSN
tara:strand:- start:2451 stop:2900 length:450 start_codon:yes stop_codon:yes gene_type:complete